MYPGMTLLDLVGPLQLWSGLSEAQIELVSSQREPVATDAVARIPPTHTYETATSAPDILFVPGGTGGTLAAMRDAATVEFVRERGSRAGWITSVCTGALVLGAAGLLDGYEATTHWAALDSLEMFRAKPVRARWVIDRNRATGGGVTAGIDFGLAVMATLAGEPVARAAQLMIEYAPEPPFDSGTPDVADAATLNAVRGRIGQFTDALATITGQTRGRA